MKIDAAVVTFSNIKNWEVEDPFIYKYPYQINFTPLQYTTSISTMLVFDYSTALSVKDQQNIAGQVFSIILNQFDNQTIQLDNTAYYTNGNNLYITYNISSTQPINTTGINEVLSGEDFEQQIQENTGYYPTTSSNSTNITTQVILKSLSQRLYILISMIGLIIIAI